MTPVAMWRALLRQAHEYRDLLVFLVLMCGFRSAWADWVYVPTGSMNPTILEGDRLLIDKHVYGLRVQFLLTHLTSGGGADHFNIQTIASATTLTTSGNTTSCSAKRVTADGSAKRTEVSTT